MYLSGAYKKLALVLLLWSAKYQEKNLTIGSKSNTWNNFNSSSMFGYILWKFNKNWIVTFCNISKLELLSF